jgi:hypothetical protein
MTNFIFEMVAGDSQSITVTVVDETGAAVSLVGATVKYVIKTDVKAATNALLITSATSAITILSNTFTITLTPANTAGLAGEYYHEAEVTLLDTRVFTAFVGGLIISPTGV